MTLSLSLSHHAAHATDPPSAASGDLALRASGLGKRYGGRWALRDCTLELPQGRVAALVGPNGAGKTTLLHLAVGLAAPSAGAIEVCGLAPRDQPARVLPQIGFVAQEQPLYRGFSVAEMLNLGRTLNPRWDGAMARARLERRGIALERKVGTLSGGERAQVALALALAKRPRLLLLDEPVAALDPLARHEFLEALAQAAQEEGLTVLLSSHIIADLERVCDYLIILSAARVQLAGDLDGILRRHRRVTGPRGAVESSARGHDLVQLRHGTGLSTALPQAQESIPIATTETQIETPTLEEVALAYLGRPGQIEAETATPAEEEVWR